MYFSFYCFRPCNSLILVVLFYVLGFVFFTKYFNIRTPFDTSAYYTDDVILHKYYYIIIITGKWNAASELYVQDVFTSFGKFCRGMSQHELLD